MDGEKGKFNTSILGSTNLLKSFSTILENQDFDKRNYSLSIWDHNDNFLCLLKPASGTLEGQSYNEVLTRNIYGEETLSFTIPAYINENKENDKWDYIFNEQKVRYIEYDNITNKPKEDGIKEFVLKHYEENRNGYEKTIQCECQSLAVYELSKLGWSITFDIDYIQQNEIEQNPEDFLTLDYWLRKIFYKETNLGRVSTTTEYTYLLQGLQLRDSEGFPIEKEYSIDESGDYYFERVDEPICSSTTEIPENHWNTKGWSWEIQAIDPRRLDQQISTNIIYEQPVIDRYIEATPNNYLPYSYQCGIEQEDSDKILKLHPIKKEDYSTLRYVTSVKKSLVTCERSNIFSVIQTLCETFKVWAYFNYNYNEQGEITERKILFKTEAVNDNVIFDFSYGKNLQSCSRAIDSNDLVTKLIVPDTDSSLDSNRVLSIKQSTQNPTGESYIYNFDYFYNTGNLSRLTEAEKVGDTSITLHSDEYYINYHCGRIKNINNNITNLQSYLVPLYQRQMELEGDLSVQQASVAALKDNIQTIQEKIDAIPEEMQTISSWSDNINQQNYIGELKTLSTTTDALGNSYLYLNFGREDVIYNQDIEYPKYRLDSNGEIITGTTTSVSSYIPRFYTNSVWQSGNEVDDNEDFTKLDSNIGTPIYSNIEDDNVKFIKGFKINTNINRSYVRVRYQYAPLIYYYYLIQDYWKKIDTINETISGLNTNLQEINNKIIINESQLNSLLNEKNELILQFEKKYAPFIKEGYWESTDYQSQITPEELDTSNTTSIYEGKTLIYKKLSDLKLNSSLHNYSYYVELQENASDILPDSIMMITLNPVGTGEIAVPRYQGNDFEIFKKKDENKYILGISPDLIDTYIKNGYSEDKYRGTIEYKTSSSSIVEQNKVWNYFTLENSPYIEEKYIYLSNDNILTDTLKIYDETEENELELYTDYTYSYDYAGYNLQGERVPLNEQASYQDNIYYDYILKITLKNTPLVNSTSDFIVKYNTESTLTYLYNDAINVSEDYSMPKITYSISMVDLSGLNDYKDYKPILGQKVPIFDPEMRLNGYEGIITSISKNLEHSEETQIELATYQTKFEDIFQKLTATMTDVKYNQNELMTAADSFTPNGTIKANVFQKSLTENNYQIQLGINNNITIDKTSGITLVDQDNNNAVKIIGNGIFLTEDYNGNDSQWITGITGEGINANALTAGSIDKKNINIWNSSEGQIRFIWNEQGLFAYGSQGTSGTSTSTAQDFVDYNKFVKYSYDGLQFQDKDSEGNIRSALSLGWNGLNISAQSESLQLNAEKGLVLQQWSNGNATTRLELGKLENDSIYGLKLYDTSGSTTFQSDSDGNLWLSKYIKVGGVYDSTTTHTYIEAPTAGIVGEVSSDNNKYRMGIIRDDTTGNPKWESSMIRFWAGPQTKTEYLTQLGMTSSDISSISEWNTINDNDPALARFKVDENGNIIASGIDVGGWVGSGKILRSKNYEAILRSDGYNIDEYPVIAVGKNNNNQDGTTHNFRVYQDGSVNITKGNINIGSNAFVVDSYGNVTITQGSLNIGGIEANSTSTSIMTGNFSASSNGYTLGYGNASNSIATFKVAQHGLEFTNENYITGVYAYANTNDYVFRAGPSSIPNFSVDGKGSVVANDITITGSSGNWIINSEEFQVTKQGYLGAGVRPLERPSTFSVDNYDFSVYNGSIRFRGSIYAWDNNNNKFQQGLESGIFTLGNTTLRVIQGLVVSIQ